MKTVRSEINKNGGFAGHILDIVEYNEEGKTEKTIAIANKIASKK
ncbi:MAG: hypothetical protein Q9M40_05940 [Sulfurimonas sp.]|nr:hypothetical protein [Sulfurimonas sp.]